MDSDARTILNNDDFLGNNDGGADGKALAKAVVDQASLTLGVGNYKAILTGTVKGNNALYDLPFTVAGTIHIVAPGCHN